ncbi:hypothetical protein [Amycolatopsis alkalitolerans]|uniref:Uncharacterized protein n=1 Tax=Amycolatopsis alkalitolerans TaxID=2547244 RepID=A0A5C4LZ38_9PSEU|nr:hypothetical protein [Amycolatopsis alkalitolerans]TNC22473.1 hypothetical protein FG385_24970 [Amycolatopsis alkalitolerans]
MTEAFGAVPDDLRKAASAIGEVVGGVAGLAWRGPSGDYGHAGVQSGWARFIDDMRDQVAKLQSAAGEHGVSLEKAAIEYVEADSGVGHSLAAIGNAIAETGGEAGFMKPREPKPGDVGSGPAGVMSPERSRELFPRYDIGSRLDPGVLGDDDGRDY